MKKKYIQVVKIEDVKQDRLPPFIYNRYDLWFGNNDYIILKVNDYYVEVLIDGDNATIGSIMLTVTQKDFFAISRYVLSIRRKVKCVILKDSQCHIRFASTHNYGVVELYNDDVHNKARIVSKHRNTYKNSIKQLEAQCGEMKFVEYHVGTIPANIFRFYFTQKYNQMNTQYNMTNEQYISNYHVTNAYVLYFGNYIGYVAFSCEQTPIVFLENHAYDICKKEYSLGTIGFLLYLKTLGQKGFKYLYLGHCDYSYKKRFSNHTTIVYTSIYYKSFIMRLFVSAKYFLKKIKKRLNIFHKN